MTLTANLSKSHPDVVGSGDGTFRIVRCHIHFIVDGPELIVKLYQVNNLLSQCKVNYQWWI
jgi:hypothetical protein